MNSTDIILKMVFDRWNASLKAWDKLLSELSDEQLQKEIAPGKNRGVYLLGHVIAVHDDMLVLLDMGERLYPDWHQTFIDSPDKAVPQIPSVQELRDSWSNQCEVIKQRLENLSPDDWFDRHTAVSAEDFVKEPHRNKLNIIITRTSHLNYHTGQFVLLT